VIYNIDFDLVATFLLGITLILFYYQKNVKNRSSFWFQLLLWDCLASTLFSILGSIATNSARFYGYPIVFIANTTYYLLQSSIMLLVALYVIATTGSAFSSIWRKLFFLAPFTIASGLILTNYWSGYVFFIDDGLRFHRGPAIPVLYGLSFLYLSHVYFQLILQRKNIDRISRTILPVSLLIPFIGVLVQNAIPGILLECFSASVTLLIVYFTIQNSTALIDEMYALFNRTAFIHTTETKERNHLSFDILLISMQNISVFRHIYDIKDLMKMFRMVSRFLSRQAGKNETAFYLGKESYALLFERAIPEKTKMDLVQGIRGRFERPWTIGNSEVEIPIRMCHLHCPEEANGASDIFDCLEQIWSLTIRDGHSGMLRASDLNPEGRKREADTQRALGKMADMDRIEMLYQPVFSVKENRFCFADSLITYKDGKGERIDQRDLIRAAERNGLMQRIGSLALNSVCGFYMENTLREKGIEHIQIRLSGAQCMQSDLAQQILSMMDSCKMDSSNICFELTEPTVVQSSDIMNLNMKMLSSQGHAFALDDYGSGYTDLGRVMELPFNLFKLDKGIIHAGFTSSKGKIILTSTIALIKRLNRKIIAEGVETEEQAGVLTILGCDYLQGFFFSPPVTGEEFLSLL